MANIANLLTEHIDIWTAAESEKKSGRGRASGNAGNVYGVKKLRELVLELAVRGKLVPQDPNDEPASELLKRIQAEKAKLIAEGKLKKDKPLAQISEVEIPFDLPKGWEWVRFQDISTYIQRGKGPEYVDHSEHLVISQKCVRWDGIDLSVARYISPESLTKYEEVRFLKNNDLLWNSTGTGTIGRACLYKNIEGELAAADSHVTIVRTIFGVEQFLFRYIQSPIVQNEIEEMASGTTNQIELNTSTVIAHLLPLPPLAEQHRIVAKVDELMALCDQLEQQHSNAQEAHETLVNQLLATLTQSQNAAEFNANWQRIYAHFDVLFTTEASIDALKQTLLQLAVMGKLVPQDPNDEPASELLKRIQAEKAKLIAEGKLKKDKPLAPIGEDEKPFDLPKGWEWTTLLNAAAAVNPRNNAPDDIEASFVPMTYIGSAFSDKHQDEKRLWKDIKQGFTHFAEGDIGVAKITPCFENSKACVFENLENGLGAGTTELHIVRPVMNTLNPRYVLAYLKSPRFLELGESKMTGTAGQKRLPKDFVETNPFPLPPLAEQQRIVAKVDELMALCDQLKTRIQQAKQQQQAIADALVAQAVA
jgi:type I restriction enzyme, S subunit